MPSLSPTALAVASLSPVAMMIRRPESLRARIAAAFVVSRVEKAREAPTMKSKNGKIRSVGVQPFQAACSSGAWTAPQSPG